MPLKVLGVETELKCNLWPGGLWDNLKLVSSTKFWLSQHLFDLSRVNHMASTIHIPGYFPLGSRNNMSHPCISWSTCSSGEGPGLKLKRRRLHQLGRSFLYCTPRVGHWIWAQVAGIRLLWNRRMSKDWKTKYTNVCSCLLLSWYRSIYPLRMRTAIFLQST